VVNTFMAKGAVDMDAPYALFTIGLQARDRVLRAVDNSDLVIALGYDMVEYEPALWNPKGDHRILHIDFLPAEVDQHYHTELEVVGDLAHALWGLNERLDRDGPLEVETSEQQAVRREMLEEFAEYKDDDQRGTIRPQKVLWDVRCALDREDILLCDVGAHKMWVGRYYQCHEPNTCLIPNGFCSMGFALPGAVAAKLANPMRRVMAICGDGGFLMNAQEMETARRLNTSITVMVWEDHAYGLIAWKQKNHFGRHTNLSFGNPDFVALAESYGWGGYRCDNSADLGPTLRESLRHEGPSLVVVPIDYRENQLLTERLGKIAHPI
jgi:acetolactate synthase-1/2/3 large subunit